MEPSSDKPVVLKLVVLLTIGLIVMAVIPLGKSWLAEPSRMDRLVTVALLVCWAAGMARFTEWARTLAVVAYWFLVFLPLGLLTPFYAGDVIAQGRPTPPLWKMLLVFALLISTALWCLHILGKYKDRFRRKWI
ncbi:MAG TPA: hypothetical protein DEO88_09450 [Syntrophobacteraceae bacterium]|jgi:hypothetical protein|nr:hypothetical protein [Syntrophobacteraceae bacterium]